MINSIEIHRALETPLHLCNSLHGMLTLGIYKPDLIDDKELFNSLRGALQNCIDVLDKKLIELDKKLIDTQER